LALGELAFDDHLRGDAGVIGAGLPQHVAAVHPLIAAQHVLQRVVERVAHVQVAGDVGRRDDDAIGFGVAPLGPSGAERARRLPARGGALLDFGDFERFIHHLAATGAGMAERGVTAARRVEERSAAGGRREKRGPSLRSATAAPA
jgi:hypothetical protein